MVTLEDMRAGLEKRFAARARAEAAEAARLRGLFPEVIEFLRGQGATEVWLFGSLAEQRFREDSDVDLAVRGLGFHEWLRAATGCVTLLGRAVDLIQLEEASGSLSNAITSTGERLL